MVCRLMKTSSTFLAPTLCGILLMFPAVSSAKTHKPADAAKLQAKLFQKKLSKDEQMVHALDRLAFGPRPGDIERVKRMGLKKWINQQLHPDRLAENPVLEAHLEALESLRMTPLEAEQHYPSPQMIRAIAQGRQPLPSDPLLRSSVERLLVRYRTRIAQASNTPVAPDQQEDLEPIRSLDEVLTPVELEIVRSGNGERKRELLESMPQEKIEDMLVAMTQRQRLQVFGPASSTVRREIFLLNAPQQVVAYDLLDSKMLRAIESTRQLAEELDDFWFNHFNVFYEKGADRFLIPQYEREAIRPHVLGQFRDLLEATAKSPAMLFFLDNFESVRPDLDANNTRRKVKRGLNENYGRELMELHTLGVNGGYTQKDVTEVARCFTGWTIRAPREGGRFFYNDKLHDKGEKIVLGHVIAAGGGNRRRRAGAGYSRQASFYRAFHFERAGPALRRRQSSRGARQPDGANIPGHQRQHSRSDEDHAEFQGILVSGRVPGQSEIAFRDGGQLGSRAGRQCRSMAGRWRIKWGGWASRSIANWSPPVTRT